MGYGYFPGELVEKAGKKFLEFAEKNAGELVGMPAHTVGNNGIIEKVIEKGGDVFRLFTKTFETYAKKPGMKRGHETLILLTDESKNVLDGWFTRRIPVHDRVTEHVVRTDIYNSAVKETIKSNGMHVKTPFVDEAMWDQSQLKQFPLLNESWRNIFSEIGVDLSDAAARSKHARLNKINTETSGFGVTSMDTAKIQEYVNQGYSPTQVMRYRAGMGIGS